MSSWSSFARSWYQNREYPEELFLGRGMLSSGEVKALYSCGADFYRGNGHIVDAGAFAGMSAHSFACGLRANADQSWALKPVIHSYDRFIADEPYVADYLRNVFYSARSTTGGVKEVMREAELGEDFLHVFWHQNQRFSDLIEAHQGDFLQAEWPDAPIEILFMDVAKTKALQNHMLRHFLPCLLPGASILIQQDYNHVWHPYIHLAMEVLAPCVDILVKGESASRFYYFREPPSASLLAEAMALEFDAHQIDEAYDRIVSNSEPRFKAMLELARVKALSDHGFVEEAGRAVVALTNTFPGGNPPDWVKTTIEKIR